jgi:molybdopterin synthase catalytic subunit
MRAALVTHPLDVGALLNEVAGPRHGATVLFVGTVRSFNEGREVSAIEYTAYETMAQREMSSILAEAGERNDGAVLVAEHRTGMLAVGEASIIIAAAHARRSSALDALRYAINEIKSRVPIWKRELYVDGGHSWVDPTGVAAT